MGLTGPPKKVEAKPLSEAAKGRLDALRGRVAAVRQQRQGPGPGQGQGQRQAPGQVGWALHGTTSRTATICGASVKLLDRCCHMNGCKVRCQARPRPGAGAGAAKSSWTGAAPPSVAEGTGAETKLLDRWCYTEVMLEEQAA